MRNTFLDHLRGLAVVAMIIFHTAYDMRLLNFTNWDFSQGFWYAFPRGIAFTFLFCVGVSLNYVHQGQINWPALKKRSIKLGGAAFLISLATYFTFPQNWIYFGTLHCIFLGSILGALVVNKRRLAGIIFALILIGQYILDYDIKWVSSILKRQSMDFIPIYPWFWVILLGLLVGPHLSKIRQLSHMKPILPLKWLGHHSLVIYLVHQPIIFGLLMLIKKIR